VQAGDLGRLERRLDELAAALRPRDGAPAPVAAADGTAPTPGAGEPAADPSLADRLASLEQRITALERGGRQGPSVPEDLGAVASKELDALGKTLVQLKRYDEAQRVLKELLGRTDLGEDERTEAEMQLGYALRGLGKHAESEARFRETMTRVGEDTEKGAWAGFQIGWDRYYQKDYAGASVRMERSANASGVGAIVRVHSLYNAASFARQAGDTERARVLLERLLDNHAADIPATQAYMKTQAEAWLKEIRGN